MAKDEKQSSFASAALVFSVVLLGLSCYFQMVPLLVENGIEYRQFNMLLALFKDVFLNTWGIRMFILLLIIGSCVMKVNKKTTTPLKTGIIWAAVGTVLFLLPVQEIAPLYTVATFSGMSICVYGYGVIFRQMKGGEAPEKDSFLQTDELIETKYSVNIPYHYFFKKKRHDAYINIVNPFRSCMITGLPGSGKSFSIFNKCIEDTVRKGYSIFLYDFKFPDQSEELLNEIYYQQKHENLWQKDKVKPKFYVLNFDDATKSNRCNPIHHSYISDPADTSEIADLLFKNINKGAAKEGFDFFNESAKVYLDALIWFLANYDPDAIYGGEDGYTVIGSSSNYTRKGIYCTFPHVIELMAYNYKKVFQIMQFTHGLEAKMSPFMSAMEEDAMEQLMGQVASAQIPLGKFVSPALYWVMSGDDFTLDINNPDEPKVVCMGNNPDRQAIYGSAIALYTSRMFKLINHKGKRHCAVFFDELPTVFIKGLDNLIATARSNKVAIFLGAQDRTQLKRDYGDKEAAVIFNTVGNILSGQVNEETAESYSKMFGKEFREQHSKSISDDSDSTSISFQLQELLPAADIGTGTQGMFFGRLADNYDTPIERKLFAGIVDVDAQRAKNKKAEWQSMPVITDFFEGKEPEIPEKDLVRLRLQNPKIKDNIEALRKEYKGEIVQKIIEKNFNKVKDECGFIVEKEFKRTTPFAEAYKAQKAS